VLIDPRAPTKHHPGSEEKLRVLEARASACLPLFVEGDAVGARSLTPRPRALPVSLRSQRERQLIAVLNGQPQTPLDLAVLTAIPLRRVHHALGLLKEAGVAQCVGRRGWRLAEIPQP